MCGGVWAFDPPKVGFPYPAKIGEPRRVQKGDGKIVVVFHTSTIGAQEHIADVDIIVNHQNQPGCEKNLIKMSCNHFAAFILRELILQNSDKILKNEDGIPFASSYLYDEQFPFDIVSPQLDKKGVFYLRTGDIF